MSIEADQNTQNIQLEEFCKQNNVQNIQEYEKILGARQLELLEKATAIKRAYQELFLEIEQPKSKYVSNNTYLSATQRNVSKEELELFKELEELLKKLSLAWQSH